MTHLYCFTFYNVEDKPVSETEDDDDCKIITESSVFDHIRRKAKTLPVLHVSDDTCSPSLEDFKLIRKRTRERHLELDNDIMSLEVQSKIPRSRVATQYPEPTDTEHKIQIIDEDGPTGEHIIDITWITNFLVSAI